MFIGTEKLTHTYMPGTPYAMEALNEVTFSLRQGEFALIIGPSGSGKSTLIQHLNGLLKPLSGRVFFEGQAIGSDKAGLLNLRRRIGLVFQMPEEQFFSESVYDEIAFAPRNLGLNEDEVRSRVKDALQKVGLILKAEDDDALELARDRVAVGHVWAVGLGVLLGGCRFDQLVAAELGGCGGCSEER